MKRIDELSNKEIANDFHDAEKTENGDYTINMIISKGKSMLEFDICIFSHVYFVNSSPDSK